MSIDAPFPWFGGKSRVADVVWERFGDVPNYVERCSSQSQFAGCRPVRFVALFVDQRCSRRADDHDAIACSRYSGTCIAKCCAFDVNSRFEISSFSLSSSLWWMPIRGGIGPLADSQTNRARNTQTLGSATFTKARLSPPLLCRVRIRTEPTGYICSLPWPRAFFIGVIIPCLFWMLRSRGSVGRGELRRRYGNVLATFPTFVEPFFGSGAVLLGRPDWHKGRTETVNDKDGFVANFWRAVQHDPEQVAFYADNPVNENDLHARHSWLVGQRDDLTARLEGDPEFYDPKIAGWWVWGICCWIGAGWCSGEGPWHVEDGRLVNVKGDAGQGVNRQLVHLGDAGRGVNRKLVHLGGAGQGVNRKLAHLGAGRGVNRQLDDSGLVGWFTALADRLRDVRVCSGDWSRVCGPSPTFKHGMTAVFLDPPYDQDMRADLYRVEDSVSAAVREWAIENGSNPLMRIALCGYEGEHVMPGWEVYEWKSVGGFGSQGDEASRGKSNRELERIWFSPACLKPSTQGVLL